MRQKNFRVVVERVGCDAFLKCVTASIPAAGPFFSWPAVFLSGDQASLGFSFINSIGKWGSKHGVHVMHPSCTLPALPFRPPLLPAAGAVGGFIGPYMLGLLSDRSDGGFSTAFYVLAAFLGVAGAAILAFPAPGHSETHRHDPAAGGLKAAPEGDEETGASGALDLPRRHRLAKGDSKLGAEVEFQPILQAGSGSHVA